MNEIRDILVSALHDVDAAEVPDDLREVAFAKAIELRSGRMAPTRTNVTEEGDALDRIASRLDLERGVVEDTFHERDGEIELIVGARRFSARAAPATKEIALVVAAGHQAAGIDEWTSVTTIRKICENYRRLDSPNFAATIREMEDVFTFRGPARQREVKVARPGWERAAALVRRLAGVEE